MLYYLEESSLILHLLENEKLITVSKDASQVYQIQLTCELYWHTYVVFCNFL
jgi:hypothetical protein